METMMHSVHARLPLARCSLPFPLARKEVFHSPFSTAVVLKSRRRFQLAAPCLLLPLVASPGHCFAVDVSMASTGFVEPVDVAVKAAVGKPQELGDCPFSQHVLLTLETKGVKYNSILIDSSNKPQWFLDANPEGKVPVIKHAGAWVSDSDTIVGLLEKQYPEPSLTPPQGKEETGAKLFPSMVRFLKSSDTSDGTEGALVAELSALEEQLAQSAGPFLFGAHPSAVDLSLAPKLYHLRVTLKAFKSWSIPSNLSHVEAYTKALEGLPTFAKTAPPEEYVVAGWSKALGA